MIKNIELDCDNCLGFELTGEITGADYEDIMIPKITEKLKDYSKIGLVYNIGDGFEKYKAKAIFDDMKVGFKYMRAFERIAVVTDLSWIKDGINMFHFIFPGEIKIFKNSELDAAKEWVSKTPVFKQGLEISMDEEKGVMYFKPLGKITSDDFEYLGKLMDPYLERKKDLKGLVIDASAFDGYESFSAFVSHFKFVKGHQKHIEKLAILTDSNLISFVEKLASVFIHAEIKKFKVTDKDEALKWVEK